MDMDNGVAHAAIFATIATYAHAADTADYHALSRCFTAEGCLRVGANTGLSGRDRIATTLIERAAARGHGGPAGDTFQRHAVSSILIQREGDSARVSSYFTVFTEVGLDHLGRYEDLFIRSGDDWLIQDRHAKLDAFSPKSRFAAQLAGQAPNLPI